MLAASLAGSLDAGCLAAEADLAPKSEVLAAPAQPQRAPSPSMVSFEFLQGGP